MAYLSETVKDLLRLGGNVIVGGSYMAETMKEFAHLAKKHNVMLTIKVGSYRSETLKEIVRIGGKNVTIEV